MKFNTNDPIGFLLTWTSYGTWLPGDERGWQRRGEGTQRPSELSRLAATNHMKETTFTLDKEDRTLLEETIRRHCEIRDWVLHAVNVRTNHVHAVVTAPKHAPDKVAGQFKSWCTRKLKEKHTTRDRFWTESGSCKWINDEDGLEMAIVYTNEAQDRKGMDS